MNAETLNVTPGEQTTTANRCDFWLSIRDHERTGYNFVHGDQLQPVTADNPFFSHPLQQQFFTMQDGTTVFLKLVKNEPAQPYPSVSWQHPIRQSIIYAQLRHPNIVRFYGLARTDRQTTTNKYGKLEQIAIITEAIDGINLYDFWKCANPEQKIHIITQLCDVMFYCEQNNIIHGDLNPNNILVDRQEMIKICDFDLVHKLNSKDNVIKSVSALTPNFSPPEQMNGYYSLKTNTYNLSATLDELMSNVPPSMYVPKRHTQYPHHFRKDIDQKIHDILNQGLEVHYQNRPFVRMLRNNLAILF